MKNATIVLVAKPPEYMRFHAFRVEQGFMCPFHFGDMEPHFLDIRRVGVKCCKDCDAILMIVREEIITERSWWPGKRGVK